MPSSATLVAHTSYSLAPFAGSQLPQRFPSTTYPRRENGFEFVARSGTIKDSDRLRSTRMVISCQLTLTT